MSVDALSSTRASFHILAEHVLAAARYRATGRIGLEVTPGGFATPPFGDDAMVVAVEGLDLVTRRAGHERRAPITTLRAAGELVGIEPGAPSEVYPPATRGDLDAPLVLDPDVAARLAEWYALGAAALRRFSVEIATDAASSITLWPEHLDVAIRAADVNYGASPGDEVVPDPYVYIGPPEVPTGPSDGPPFWNQSFGAARPWRDVRTVDDAVRFFHEGRNALGHG
jgi:hypothetical protein